MIRDYDVIIEGLLISLYINKISMSVYLFIYLFVCLSVCLLSQTLERMGNDTDMRFEVGGQNFPGDVFKKKIFESGQYFGQKWPESGRR